jgi:hypothetical protein
MKDMILKKYVIRKDVGENERECKPVVVHELKSEL